jgi:hypothetical protein
MMIATGGDVFVMIDYNHEIAPAGSSEANASSICPRFPGPFSSELGDDIREKLVFEAGNLIFKAELALFQARKPKLITLRRGFQRNDGFVEVPVLLSELSELMAEAYIVRSAHQTSGEDAKNARPRNIADVFHHITNPEIRRRLPP